MAAGRISLSSWGELPSSLTPAPAHRLSWSVSSLRSSQTRGPGVIPGPQLVANTVEQPKTSTVNDLERTCTLSIAPGRNKVFHDNPGAMIHGKGVQHLPSQEEELKEVTDRLQ